MLTAIREGSDEFAELKLKLKGKNLTHATFRATHALTGSARQFLQNRNPHFHEAIPELKDYMMQQGIQLPAAYSASVDPQSELLNFVNGTGEQGELAKLSSKLRASMPNQIYAFQHEKELQMFADTPLMMDLLSTEMTDAAKFNSYSEINDDIFRKELSYWREDPTMLKLLVDGYGQKCKCIPFLLILLFFSSRRQQMDRQLRQGQVQYGSDQPGL